jgi:pyridoxine 5-phosphate synthase
VPERRQEVTTEGGLDVIGAGPHLRDAVAALGAAGCRVSLFIDPEPAQLDAARAAGAPVIELHTGSYCDAQGEAQRRELERLRRAARHAASIGLECHAGHGLSYANVRPVAALPEIVELNIGHFLIGEAVAIGLPEAMRRMRELMQAGRRDLARPDHGG